MTLTQLVLNWTYSSNGISSVLAGARNIKQIEENLGSVNYQILGEDFKKIEFILDNRLKRIESI